MALTASPLYYSKNSIEGNGLHLSSNWEQATHVLLISCSSCWSHPGISWAQHFGEHPMGSLGCSGAGGNKLVIGHKLLGSREVAAAWCTREQGAGWPPRCNNPENKEEVGVICKTHLAFKKTWLCLLSFHWAELCDPACLSQQLMYGTWEMLASVKYWIF